MVILQLHAGKIGYAVVVVLKENLSPLKQHYLPGHFNVGKIMFSEIK